MSKRVLVFGVTGQDGAYLPQLLPDEKYWVCETLGCIEVAMLEISVTKLHSIQNDNLSMFGMTAATTILTSAG